jgi:hypothetical protein
MAKRELFGKDGRTYLRARDNEHQDGSVSVAKMASRNVVVNSPVFITPTWQDQAGEAGIDPNYDHLAYSYANDVKVLCDELKDFPVLQTVPVMGAANPGAHPVMDLIDPDLAVWDYEYYISNAKDLWGRQHPTRNYEADRASAIEWMVGALYSHEKDNLNIRRHVMGIHIDAHILSPGTGRGAELVELLSTRYVPATGCVHVDNVRDVVSFAYLSERLDTFPSSGHGGPSLMITSAMVDELRDYLESHNSEMLKEFFTRSAYAGMIGVVGGQPATKSELGLNN